MKGDRGNGNGSRRGESGKAQVTTRAVVEEVDEFTIIADTAPVVAPTVTTSTHSHIRGTSRGTVREDAIEPQTKQHTLKES